MITLGPHIITYHSDDGDEQEIHVTINFLGQVTRDLGEGVNYVSEFGEVFVQFEDGERRLPTTAHNTLPLVGVGIMIGEAYTRGICLLEGGSVYRDLVGDCDGAGRMFR